MAMTALKLESVGHVRVGSRMRKEEAVRIMSKLQFRESCQNTFMELELLTLPCFYIFDVSIYCWSKSAMAQARDFHHYETRGSENYRTQQHRAVTFAMLPSQAGVKSINQLPEGIKNFTKISHFV
ncbi:hypothetical protein J6590_038214 [Homalodisca vitripennis]|nr:hypothetical protein J6590_038214 [Homalodisca vitripennis]